jgi:hypothetical protein
MSTSWDETERTRIRRPQETLEELALSIHREEWAGILDRLSVRNYVRQGAQSGKALIALRRLVEP